MVYKLKIFIRLREKITVNNTASGPVNLLLIFLFVEFRKSFVILPVFISWPLICRSCSHFFRVFSLQESTYNLIPYFSKVSKLPEYTKSLKWNRSFKNSKLSLSEYKKLKEKAVHFKFLTLLPCEKRSS